MMCARMLVIKMGGQERTRAALSHKGVLYIAMENARPVVSAHYNPRHPAVAVVVPKKRGCWIVEHGSQSILHQQGFIVRDMASGVSISWGLTTYQLSLCRAVRLALGLRKSLCAVVAMLVVAVVGYVMRTPSVSVSMSEPLPSAAPEVVTSPPASRIEALMAHDDNPREQASDAPVESPSSLDQSDDVRRVYARYEEGIRLMADDNARAALDTFRAVRDALAKMPVRPPFAASLDEDLRAAESKAMSTYDTALEALRLRVAAPHANDPWEAMTALKELKSELQSILAEAPGYSPAQTLGDAIAQRMRSVAARMLAAAVSVEEYQGCAAARASYARVIEAAGDDESVRRAEEALKRCDKS